MSIKIQGLWNWELGNCIVHLCSVSCQWSLPGTGNIAAAHTPRFAAVNLAWRQFEHQNWSAVAWMTDRQYSNRGLTCMTLTTFLYLKMHKILSMNLKISSFGRRTMQWSRTPITLTTWYKSNFNVIVNLSLVRGSSSRKGFDRENWQLLGWKTYTIAPHYNTNGEVCDESHNMHVDF